MLEIKPIPGPTLKLLAEFVSCHGIEKIRFRVCLGVGRGGEDL